MYYQTSLTFTKEYQPHLKRIAAKDMKQLILIRHAKSSWDDHTLRDYDRPLNQRGLRDAPVIANILKERGNVHPDLCIMSPAKRTVQTGQFFIDALGITKEKVVLTPELYDGTPQVIMNTIKKINDAYNNVVLVAHNTGLTDFINELSNVHVDNFPTCGVFSVKIDIEKWKDFPKAEKKFWFFEYPKLHHL